MTVTGKRAGALGMTLAPCNKARAASSRVPPARVMPRRSRPVFRRRSSGGLAQLEPRDTGFDSAAFDTCLIQATARLLGATSSNRDVCGAVVDLNHSHIAGWNTAAWAAAV